MDIAFIVVLLIIAVAQLSACRTHLRAIRESVSHLSGELTALKKDVKRRDTSYPGPRDDSPLMDVLDQMHAEVMTIRQHQGENR